MVLLFAAFGNFVLTVDQIKTLSHKNKNLISISLSI